MCRLILTLSCVALFVYPSLSYLNKHDLQSAVDAFDGFVEPPRSNKAKDKEGLPVTEIVHTEGAVEQFEGVADITTKKSERVIPVREDVVEDEVVTEKAKCVVGCSIELNVSNPELVQFAKDSLLKVPNGENLELVQLIRAVREVQNRIIYYLTVEATEKCENDEKSCNVICVLKMERHPWRLTKPQLTYQNCTNDSVTSTTSSHENDNDRNVSFNNIINPPEIIENSSGNIKNGTTTTVNYDEVISSLNEEIIEVNNYNVSNKETYAVEASVKNNENHEPETITKVNFEVVPSNYDETTIGTTDLSYETSTLSSELSSTEQTTLEELSVTEAAVIPDLTTSNTEISI